MNLDFGSTARLAENALASLEMGWDGIHTLISIESRTIIEISAHYYIVTVNVVSPK